MGIFRTMARRLAEKVASQVARNELFEQAGDRTKQAPLESDAWSPAVGEDDEDEEPSCSTADLRVLEAAMKMGPMLVVHWATWCSSCVDEVPALVDLHRRWGEKVRFVGVSWDAFMDEITVADAVPMVSKFARQQNMTWSQLVVDSSPEHFFECFSIDNQQVPQAWLVDANGERLHTVDGPIDSGSIQALQQCVEAI